MARPRAPRVCHGIVSRAEAKEKGFPRYFTGEPCRRGHVDERQVSNGTCMACQRETGLETKRAGCRRRYHANKETVSEKYRSYYLERADYMRERAKRYRKESAEKVNFNSSRRHARRRAAEGDFSREDIARIRAAQKSRCAVCGCKMGRKTESIDHIVPLTKGGTNWPKNLQLVCRSCNSRKRNKDPIEFMRQTGRLL